MKRLLLLALLPFGALHPLTAEAALDRAAFVNLGASVLRIEAPGERGVSLGSGVAVIADSVITNRHVTRDAKEIFVVRGGARWAAAAHASDIERDQCLLDVPGLEAPPAAMGRSAALAVGQAVTAPGSTGGLGIQNSAGEVVELHRHGEGRVIQSSNWLSSGASGGGLFDDAGRLVGILAFRLRGGQAHHFAAPAEWVRRLLTDTDDGAFGKGRPSATQQVHYWQADEPDQPRSLKAAILLRDARWGELESMAAQWSRSDPLGAEPWHLLGTALEQLGRLAEANQALECSLHLEPLRCAARTRLAALKSLQSSDRRAPIAGADPCRNLAR